MIIIILFNAVDEATVQHRIYQSNIYRLVEAYRSYGHKKAALDPLQLTEAEYVRQTVLVELEF